MRQIPTQSRGVKKVLFIQHGDVDKPGLLADALAAEGGELVIRHPYIGDKIPADLVGYDALALGGGGQSAYQVAEFPYLEEECELVRKAILADKPVLGLCLGAQLIAKALGADVYRAEHKELGFFPVSMSASAVSDRLLSAWPLPIYPAHWHGDVFDLPSGAEGMASSALTPNQAFRYGRATYAFQFHLEMTPALFEELVDDSAADLIALGVDLEALKKGAERVLPALKDTAIAFFKAWASLVKTKNWPLSM